jgi:ATP-dependent RNA helicase HelY
MAKTYSRRRGRRKLRIPEIKPGADERLREVFASIGVPEQAPFRPDPFQLEALEVVERADCLVTAPTGAGKTWIAEQAIAQRFSEGGRSWYASPLKALSNSKHAEFSRTFGAENVGILTGDRKENLEAPIVVGTTEILRNQLYDAMHMGEDVATDFVVLDEAHFLGDPDRGVVWEEVMIYLPSRIPMLMLSATIGNAGQIADWLSSIRHRECVVVQETERPVELAPLFFHPSGTLLPLLSTSTSSEKALLDKKVRAYVRDPDPPRLAPPRRLPPFGDMLGVLRQYHLLPAIFFLKSRSDCDRALDLCQVPEQQYVREQLQERVDELLEPGSFLANHRQRWHLEHLAVGAHHGGQLPAWKLLLETLMTEGLLDAIFATSTVAAGVNFPARSVVFLNSDRFDGNEFVPLTPTEFHQMIGRAGRRGKDHIGFAIAVPGEFMDAPLIAKLLASPPSDISSQIRINFSMVLNLLLSHTPEQILDLLQRSFLTYRAGKRKEKRYQFLSRAFSRHLSFLQETGYVTRDGKLTYAGTWASQLRVDQPLLIAEGLRLGVLPGSDPALLAGIIASFVNERETDDDMDEAVLPRRLEEAFIDVQRSLRSFMWRMIERGFEVRPLFLRPALTMHAWAEGHTWRRVLDDSGMAAGDLAMLISRTADNLRHVHTLGDVFPQVAAAAGRAVDLIMREPVIMEYE